MVMTSFFFHLLTLQNLWNSMDVVCGRAWSAVVGVSTLVVVLLATRSGGTVAEYLTPGFRPPSVPLVVVDPYLRYSVEYLHKQQSCHRLSAILTAASLL